MASQFSNPNSPASHSDRKFEDFVANLFRQHGWRVKREPSLANKRADLAIARGTQRYIVEIKAASEGRPDRLVPLLSQAILQARAFARASPESAAPLAVVAAPAISPRGANSLIRFLAEFAPDAAAGIVDREGFRHFVGPGLESLTLPRRARLAGRSCLRPNRRICSPTSASGC